MSAEKLALIAALIHDPKLIIMDEPFVGLDPKAAHEVKQLMRNICDNGGAIFFSTHVLEVAEKLCDKVAIIKNGKLIKEGLVNERPFIVLANDKSGDRQRNSLAHELGHLLIKHDNLDDEKVLKDVIDRLIANLLDSDDEITEDEEDDIEMSEEDNYEDDSYDKDIDDDDLVDDDYSDLSIVDEDELDSE